MSTKPGEISTKPETTNTKPAKMNTRHVKVSMSTFTKLQQLSDAVFGMPVDRVIDELARVDVHTFRQLMVDRLKAEGTPGLL